MVIIFCVLSSAAAAAALLLLNLSHSTPQQCSSPTHLLPHCIFNSHFTCRYKLFFTIFFKDEKKKALIYEAEKVGISMTNNQEKAIMEGVKTKAYSAEEAANLLCKDTVQIHAARWFSHSSNDIGVVENMDLLVWPRPEIERMEVLCFSRWKSGSGQAEPFKLMNLRFSMFQVCMCRWAAHTCW